MSFFEFRQWIEGIVPWWVPFVIPFIVIAALWWVLWIKEGDE